MQQITQGDTATLTVQWYEYVGGPAADVTGLTITITTLTGAIVLGPTSSGVSRIATGLYSYGWLVGAGQAVGGYIAVWKGIDAQLDPVQASEIFAVVSVTVTGMSVWATHAEVLAITHKDDLVQADVDMAEEVIMLHIERTTTDQIRLRDRFWLKRAVAWQAAWQVDQPGYRERSTAKEVTQDGTKIVWAHAGDPANASIFMLAPLATRALKNCSWMKTRSDRWRPARPPNIPTELAWPGRTFPQDYRSNDDHRWEPM